MGEISMGTVYDINKTAMNHEKLMGGPAIDNKLNEVVEFIKSKNEYFMMLCHERRDYTLFRLIDFKEKNYKQIKKDIKECLTNRGKIIDIDWTPSHDAFEFWLKIDEESFCYYFFKYDEGVIES